MGKHDFLQALRAALSEKGLTVDEIQKVIEFQTELIDDCMEDGVSEEEAVNRLGSIDDIVRNVLLDMPLRSLVRSDLENKKKRMQTDPLLLILAIVGFPLWFPLFIALDAVILAVFTTIFSVMISLFVAAFSLAVGGLLIIPASLLSFAPISPLLGIGAGIVLIGIAILFFLFAKWASVWLFRLVALTVRGIKAIFIPKSRKKGANL